MAIKFSRKNKKKGEIILCKDCFYILPMWGKLILKAVKHIACKICIFVYVYVYIYGEVDHSFHQIVKGVPDANRLKN